PSTISRPPDISPFTAPTAEFTLSSTASSTITSDTDNIYPSKASHLAALAIAK
ncbi:hypothetical protein LTS18_012777, partial [Coniosporium uncinatum]